MSTIANHPPESRRLGDFEIVREIGRGGMGVVYEARQVSLNRKVALKVLGSALGLTAKAVQRFNLEAEAAGRLHHTNIVPVYATGTQDDVHFYAMELIDGPSLDRILERFRKNNQVTSAATDSSAPEPQGTDLPPSLVATGPYVAGTGSSEKTAGLTSSSLSSGSQYFDEVARMIADVADALEHAHHHGVIHRDIKPSNLMLSSDGRLSVNDFGLARLLEKPGMTITGEFMGTPAYTSPEQITAGRIPLDHRTDIYSLGATLYELLTLRPPFTGSRRDQVLAQIVQKDPKPPRKLNRQVPTDLETICLKALEKDPDRRYQTAGQMAEDLRRYVNRFAIHARRAGPLARARKWVRRHPALAAALTCALVATCAVAYFAYRAHRSDERLRTELCRAALERTTMEAMRGKFREAEAALDEAIALGASEGEIQLWRGQIELHQGKTASALTRLEEAVRLLPESVAARAILARAYLDAGQSDKSYNRGWVLSQKSRPRTAEDYLFLGQIRAQYEPAEALPLLDRALELRDSPLTRLVRAEVRTKFAQMTGLVVDAERALTDAAVALDMLPRDPLALAASLEAHLVASCIYEANKQTDRSRSELARAALDAKALQGFKALSRALRVRLLYLVLVEDVAAVRFEYLNNHQPDCATVAARCYFNMLYGKGNFTEAGEVLKRIPRAGNEAMYHLRRAYLFANHLPDGPARALAEYREGSTPGKDGRLDGRSEFYLPTILLLLGKKKEAAAIYRKLAKRGDPTEWYKKAYAFWGERLSADKLLEAAGASKWLQCEGHFYIGMNLLAQGDRAGARRHFQLSVDTRVLWYLEYEWSRAFLALMKENPAWPPWIPVKK